MVAAVIVLLVLVSVAFWVAPRACDGGFEIYLQSGIAALVVLAVLPFALQSANSFAGRIVSSVGFVILGVLGWAVGLFAANVNFLCRLF